MKKLISLALCAMMVLSMSLAFATEDKPLAGQKLTVAMSANYKYFESVVIDENGNEAYEGLDIDILNLMAEDLGFEYEIVNMPFSSLIGSLQANAADMVISGLSSTEERKLSVDFSKGYCVQKIGVLVKTDSGIKSAADFSGKQIACSAGTNYENIIKSIPDTELVTFDGQAAVTTELVLGRVDACVTSAVACKKIASENEGLEYFVMDTSEYKVDAGLSEYAIAFPKGSELTAIIDAELDAIIENGKLMEILVKWLGEDQAGIPGVA